MATFCLSLPVRIAIGPQPSDPPFLITVFGVMPAPGLFLLYFSTSSYEFDDVSVTCCRLKNVVAWSEPIGELESVTRRNGRHKDSLELRWPNRRRWVVLTNDLAAALDASAASSKTASERLHAQPSSAGQWVNQQAILFGAFTWARVPRIYEVDPAVHWQRCTADGSSFATWM